ncbi:putative DNA binding protein [Tripterygium wilfordii]|uniref:Putative DNA binding protein n=1 Tax=Tripterygium wilfordii TaxID=458696 RepID=A0A7J7D494_TRIWF|nr:nuclear transcription factor Y subunit C-5 [Tripterygium wilfordii]KAF5741160.1 putative DNA binding protein [Tripterygium wilfordii]
MADQEQPEHAMDTTRSAFPTVRVKKIMKLDKDINKVNKQALLLISRSTEQFLRFLTEKSAEAAKEKKRKTIKLEQVRIAVKRHRPTSDFLLDSLPAPTQPSDRPATDKTHTRSTAEKRAPPGTRRIDHFFSKPESEAPVQTNEP